jgi:very-short-patch-repair endonuclease
MNIHNKQSLKEFRRELRQKTTKAEDVLWEQLRNGKLNSLKFKRQHSIGNYIVDFYCASLMLVIELDGEVHNQPEQKEKDVLRDVHLKELNFYVLRITNDQVLLDMKFVKEEIMNRAK